MIELYTWPTPNGHKVHILLEELELPYEVHAVDIGNGEQFADDFLRISPNNKIPAIVDTDGPGGEPFPLFESGAILVYLAERNGRFLSDDVRTRHVVMQWLMFQMGGLGPMLGQAHHFRAYAPQRIGYAVDRYTNEAGRLYAVLDRRLAESEYLAGEYSIADIAAFPWIRTSERQGQDLADFPNVRRWYGAIDARPAVKRGLAVLADRRRTGPISEAEREVLFGSRQYERR